MSVQAKLSFETDDMRSANMSACGTYRYLLRRRWSSGPMLPFIMLNPSTADADIDDPTIRRCVGFAKRGNYAGITVGNVFAFRATDPAVMRAAADPFGPLNADRLKLIAVSSAVDGVPVIAAWGTHATHRNGANITLEILRANGADVCCLGKTQDGHPRHPLYVKGDQLFEDYP